MQEPISIAPRLAAQASTAYVKVFFAVTKNTWKEARESHDAKAVSWTVSH